MPGAGNGNWFTRWCAKQYKVTLASAAVTWVAATILGYLSYIHHDDELKAGSGVIFTVSMALAVAGVSGMAAKMALDNRRHTAEMHDLARQYATALAAQAATARGRLEAATEVHAAKLEVLMITMDLACQNLGVTASGDTIPPGRPRLRDVSRRGD